MNLRNLGHRRDVFCYLIRALPRTVAVNVAHQVTQRGNARQFMLAADSERLVYLQLLEQYVVLQGLSLLGYCGIIWSIRRTIRCPD